MTPANAKEQMFLSLVQATRNLPVHGSGMWVESKEHHVKGTEFNVVLLRLGDGHRYIATKVGDDPQQRVLKNLIPKKYREKEMPGLPLSIYMKGKTTAYNAYQIPIGAVNEGCDQCGSRLDYEGVGQHCDTCQMWMEEGVPEHEEAAQ
jgi:hypothetical protein